MPFLTFKHLLNLPGLWSLKLKLKIEFNKNIVKYEFSKNLITYLMNDVDNAMLTLVFTII